MNLSENLLTMFKLCHKVPDNDIQGFVPHYNIEDDEIMKDLERKLP